MLLFDVLFIYMYLLSFHFDYDKYFLFLLIEGYYYYHHNYYNDDILYYSLLYYLDWLWMPYWYLMLDYLSVLE